MPYQLPALVSRTAKAETINHIIEPPFQEDKQIFARDALLALRLLEIIPELSLQDPVNPFDLLFFP
jgi:hypothetical protein